MEFVNFCDLETVLVTGGTGYIGSHTAVELISKGYKVVIIDNLSNSSVEVLDGIQAITGIKPVFEKVDMVNTDELDAVLSRHKDIRHVIHFAAAKAVGESVAKPLKYYKNNLISLINLLNSMITHKIPNLVFSSSCTVYGQPDVLPVTEQAPIKPATSPYGNTKQMCEEIIRDTILANYPVKAIALRYFNPIGAHPSAHIGELPLGVPDNLVPFITQTAYGLRPALKVFGNDYNTPDGSCIRDYINIVDLALAHVTAIGRLETNKNKKPMEVFNLGTGKGISVLEIIDSFERSTGIKLNYEIVGRRPGDIEQVWADTSLANSELGWKAERTLDETLLSAWNWETKYRSRKK